MSKVTNEEKALLMSEYGDSEGYRSVSDDILKAKIEELDPEWIKEMQQLYKDSKKCRWCAR